MGFKEYIHATWDWVKNAILKVWERFKVFIVKVADFTKTVLGAVRELLQSVVSKIANGIRNVLELIKKGVKRLFLVFTPKKNKDPFTEIINKAKTEGKIGTTTMSAADIFGDSLKAEYDAHVIQTDENINTENVYSISAEELSSDLRNRAAANMVSEINISI